MPDTRRRVLEILIWAVLLVVGSLVLHGQAFHIWTFSTGLVTIATLEFIAYRTRERRRRRWDELP
jgi:hypothetical protein